MLIEIVTYMYYLFFPALLSLSLSLSTYLTTSWRLFLKSPSTFSDGNPMATMFGLMSEKGGSRKENLAIFSPGGSNTNTPGNTGATHSVHWEGEPPQWWDITKTLATAKRSGIWSREIYMYKHLSTNKRRRGLGGRGDWKLGRGNINVYSIINSDISWVFIKALCMDGGARQPGKNLAA